MGDSVRVSLGPPQEVEERPFIQVLWFREPLSKVTLPRHAPAATPYFFTLFQGPVGAEDPTVDVMVVKADGADLLWIDLDNDQDLSDDGEPLRFPIEENGLDLDLHPFAKEPRLTRHVRLERVAAFDEPEVVKRFRERFFLDDSSLRREAVAQFADQLGRNDYETGPGCFYFEKRKVVSPGRLAFDNREVAIGFVCFSGRFGEPDDVLLVDVDGDGHLSYLGSPHLYARGKPFTIGDRSFAWADVDRLGRSVTLEVVEPATDRLLLDPEPVFNRGLERDGPVRGSVGPAFWKLELEEIGGEPVRFERFRGGPVLFTFWGEWCEPCREELPDLVALADECRASGMQLVGVVQSRRPERAVRLARDAGLKGLQLRLTTDVEQRLAINGYPSNLLVLADGQGYLRMMRVQPKLVRSVLGCDEAR